MAIPGSFEPLSCSLKRLRASMKMSKVERKYSLGYRHMHDQYWENKKNCQRIIRYLQSYFNFLLRNPLSSHFPTLKLFFFYMTLR